MVGDQISLQDGWFHQVKLDGIIRVFFFFWYVEIWKIFSNQQHPNEIYQNINVFHTHTIEKEVSKGNFDGGFWGFGGINVWDFEVERKNVWLCFGEKRWGPNQ